MSPLDELHAPLIPILRHALALMPLPRVGLALDLACGPGHKTPLLAEACGPGVRLLGVDIDPDAIRAATTGHPFDKAQGRRPPTAEDRESKIEARNGSAGETRASLLAPRSCINSSVVGGRWSAVGIVGDAQALPLRDGCCAAAFCIAALSLFDDRRAALRELRRALAPGGIALLVVGVQFWAQTIRWPADLAARLAAVYAQALADGLAPLRATPDLGGDLTELLLDAGFAPPLIRSFLLDHQALYGGPSVVVPLAAELPLLPWPALRSLLAGRLGSAELARCDERAADPEIELCTIALIAQAHAA
jgi:SAM-dependent methyltransferase